MHNSIFYIIGSNCQNFLEISFGSDRVVLALPKGYTLIWCRLRLGVDQQALFFAPPNMFNRLGIFFFTSVTKYGKNSWFSMQRSLLNDLCLCVNNEEDFRIEYLNNWGKIWNKWIRFPTQRSLLTDLCLCVNNEEDFRIEYLNNWGKI